MMGLWATVATPVPGTTIGGVNTFPIILRVWFGGIPSSKGSRGNFLGTWAACGAVAAATAAAARTLLSVGLWYMALGRTIATRLVFFALMTRLNTAGCALDGWQVDKGVIVVLVCLQIFCKAHDVWIMWDNALKPVQNLTVAEKHSTDEHVAWNSINRATGGEIAILAPNTLSGEHAKYLLDLISGRQIFQVIHLDSVKAYAMGIEHEGLQMTHQLAPGLFAKDHGMVPVDGLFHGRSKVWTVRLGGGRTTNGCRTTTPIVTHRHGDGGAFGRKHKSCLHSWSIG